MEKEREREKAVLIYTLLFPALVYNYAIFSQTSPYFFVPGDAPRSKSARHEGVVKSTRPRVEPKVSSASPGVMTLWARPYAPGIASPLTFFLFSSSSSFPPSIQHPLSTCPLLLSLLFFLRIGVGGLEQTRFERRGGMHQGCELSPLCYSLTWFSTRFHPPLFFKSTRIRLILTILKNGVPNESSIQF